MLPFLYNHEPDSLVEAARWIGLEDVEPQRCSGVSRFVNDALEQYGAKTLALPPGHELDLHDLPLLPVTARFE
jgi:hypothetical protein